LKRYEVVVIVKSDLTEEDIIALLDRCQAIITDRKGVIAKVDKWGKRRLAYEINKQKDGFYFLIDFAGDGPIVAELERNLKIDDRILKFMTVKKEGFVYETKYIAKVDSSHPVVRNVDVDIKPIELNQSYRINDIYFGFNKSDLNGESKSVLDQLIEFLSENPAICIQIQGHTDNIGNDAENLSLSENRARSVYNYLVIKGISAKRLMYKGFGKTMPVADNNTEEGRAKNRRTVFVITKK